MIRLRLTAAFIALVALGGLINAGYAATPFVTQIVPDNSGAPGTSTSIAIDRRGNPHISYRSVSGLRYAHMSGTSWTFETV
ncbi:MAG: hypothetical protein KAJ17_13815, partial [Candidatus Krumholzibacteria bacterium]|nr:hypothetical protein [Candidatus Krumholzibacteria bacterium]